MGKMKTKCPNCKSMLNWDIQKEKCKWCGYKSKKTNDSKLNE